MLVSDSVRTELKCAGNQRKSIGITALTVLVDGGDNRIRKFL